MHPSPRELLDLLSQARSQELGSAQQLQLLGELRRLCPAFFPALLLASRAELWSREDAGPTEEAFAQVERMLQDAAEVSHQTPEAVLERARFESVVRGSPASAERLYREAATRALASLEEAWAGLIEALGEQEKTDDARRIADQARQLFPDSKAIAEARQFAKLEG